MDELELMLTDICQCSRSKLYSAPSLVLSDAQVQHLEKILQKRAHATPVQYSLGHTEFMGLYFNVNKHVLIPRPETELLVEAALTIITEKTAQGDSYRVLDIGTGSGCIAISLAKLLKGRVRVVALDISKKALQLAKKNARVHAVEESIQFLHSDYFSNPFFKKDCAFDVIISNPPYVPTNEIGAFDVTTLREPGIALDGGIDGCDAYRRLNQEVIPHLAKDGIFMFEIGDGQAASIREIFSDCWIIERVMKDYNHIERIYIARLKKESSWKN